jgi:hypothetical protein
MTPTPHEHFTSPLTFEYDVAEDRWTLSEELRELHGLRAGEEPTTDLIVDRIVERDRDAMLERFEHHLTHEGVHTFTYRLTDARGHQHRVSYVAVSEAEDGRVRRLAGFAVDITAPTDEATREAVAASASHRAAIEQAKGALMLSFGVDEDTAFEMLRGYSSRTNTRLALVAEHITTRLASPEFCREDPVRSLLDVITDLERLHAPPRRTTA